MPDLTFQLAYEKGHKKGYQAALDKILDSLWEYDSNELACYDVWDFIDVFAKKIQELKEKADDRG